MSDYKYMRDGTKVHVLHTADELVFVATVLQHEERNWSGDGTEIFEEDGPIIQVPARDLYDEPPTIVLSEEVHALERQIAELRETAFQEKQALREAHKTNEDQLEALATKWNALEKLSQFLDGRITHYFLHWEWSSPKILTIEETLDDRDWKEKRGRLLTLGPVLKKGKVELEWKLNQYRDGSGRTSNACIPCTSYEDALQKCQEWVDAKIEDGKFQIDVVNFAQKHGLQLPDGYVQGVVDLKQASLKRHEQDTHKKLSDARAKQEQEWNQLLDAATSDP